MFELLSKEKVIALRRDLIGEISRALLDLEPDGYPRNFTLYNALLQIFELWEEGETAYAEYEVMLEKSCGCI